ncbi:hypothetical protein HYC85_025159 [Camellia sinensis]|uniref:DNA repair protein RAD5A UBA domain-containing protein n=1 Tax=Camellia sinensis TaxID=4442 RepID=A0A7J7GA53_CAMSI|nr:hypothetical protein HYC85_025159 [Camellia sinensis]
MGNKVTDELVSTVRSIVGFDYSDMDIIRALHMANNDVTAAINIVLDTPSFRTKDKSQVLRNPEVSNRNSNSETQSKDTKSRPNGNETKNRSLGSGSSSNPRTRTVSNNDVEAIRDLSKCSSSIGGEWWFVGCVEVSGLSTCKGRRLKCGDAVNFTFPLKNASSTPSPGKFGGGRGRQVAAFSEIVRFSTKECGEVCMLSFLKL